jgi:general stress protein CsbA
VIVPALRRLALLIGAIGGATVVVSILFAVLLGASILRSIAVGFYLVGSILLLAGFFFGNRGPVRPRGEADAPSGPLFRPGGRRLRWATREEHEETINSSALYVVLGLVLILFGIASDTRHALF